MESEVAVDAEVEVGAEVEVRGDTPFLSSMQMGGVIPWPTSSTPRAGHVIMYTVFVWDNAELDTLPSIIYS